MSSPALAGGSRHAETVEQLASLIVENLGRGINLVPAEPELCLTLGVSRTVIREAVRTLAANRVIEVRRGSGTVVLPLDQWNLFDPQVLKWRFAAGITPALIDDLVEFRLTIEPHAARFAALRTDFPVHDLEVSYVRMVHATKGKGSFIEADLLFHETLLRGRDNLFINNIIPLISGALLLSFENSVANPEIAAQSLPLHKRVVDAIAAHDPDAAESAMRDVITHSREDLLVKVTP
jgi:GntR family galactonate operon transcriptional repressor